MMLGATVTEMNPQNPVQGQHTEHHYQEQQHQLGRLVCSSPHAASLFNASSPASTPTSLSHPASPTTVRRREAQFHVIETGSPTRTSQPGQSGSLRSSPLSPQYSHSYSPTQDTRASPYTGWSAMSFTGDRKDGVPQAGNSRNRMPAWLRGNGPGTQTPAGEPTEPIHAAPMKPRTSSQSLTNQTTAPTANSRPGFFASSVSALKGMTTSTPVSLPQDDELMYLDIEKALFPAGPPDSFSPSAFKNLQMNATGTIQKFQAAYQQHAIQYQELKADRSAVNEEKEEIETRVQHLKMQLEGMARKAAEQEAVMQQLMSELALEKKLRVEARHANETAATASYASTVSEDLGAEEDQEHRQRRKSGYTAKSESDMSFDTDEESIEAASVFSRSRSPTIATTITEASPIDATSVSMASPMSTLQQHQQQQRTPNVLTPRTTPRPAQQSQMGAFQKLFKGISGDANKEYASKNSCANCEGQSASIAWDTVNLLKDENRSLKEQVGELETAIEGALDVVNGIGL